MRGTPATTALRTAGIPFLEHSYAHDPRAAGFGIAAVEALGVAADRVFKTLVAQVDGVLAVGVVPVRGRLDLRVFAATLGGTYAAMADAVVAERRTGYVRGGISPVGQRHPLRTVVDESALLWDTVFVSGGRRGLELEIAPADLLRAVGATTAAITR